MSNRQTFGMGLMFGLVIALGAFVLLRSPEVALAGGPDSGTGKLGMTTGLVEGNYEWVYILDGEGKRLLVYHTNHGRDLCLAMGRNIEYDLKVQEYKNPSNSGPSVATMKKDSEKAAEKGGEGGGLK